MKAVRRTRLSAVFARPDETVLDHPTAGAAIDDGFVRAARDDEFIPLPPHALLLRLPGRSPICVDGGPRPLRDVEGASADAVAAALPVGFTRTALPAFEERPDAPPLPLYGYAAVAWDGGGFRVAAARTDALEAWEPENHRAEVIRAGIEERFRALGRNPLVLQLARCATAYGCFTAQNVFLRRGEAAIPVSPACNARCIGCISEQEPDSGVPSAQERVRALPSAGDMAALAVSHLAADPSGIISFGQGCEGEPLLAAPRIAEAIRSIRAKTAAGTIHCNTNASAPRALTSLFDAGLTSVRVSLNSARPEQYAAYYRPRGYTFEDVRESLRVAHRAGASISLNLLTHPGVTDDVDEMDAMRALLAQTPVAMVQTRTLNVDPMRYFGAVGRPAKKPVGMIRWLAWMREQFPHVRLGNFTRGFG